MRGASHRITWKLKKLSFLPFFPFTADVQNLGYLPYFSFFRHSNGVPAGYGKNVTDFAISECVTASVPVNPLQKSDGGNAPDPLPFLPALRP
jgi:hypothetical protein